MNKEIYVLRANDTWDLLDLPAGKKAISSQ